MHQLKQIKLKPGLGPFTPCGKKTDSAFYIAPRADMEQNGH